MTPRECFSFCPRCGHALGAALVQPNFTCGGCGFRYYLNPAVAAAALVLNTEGEGLFIRRAKDPARGRLALPGGFIDLGETAETALRRELIEEVNVEVGPLEFLCSSPNEYHYAGVTYPVLDLFFTATATGSPSVRSADEVESIAWIRPEKVALADIAFPSMRAALGLYLGRNPRPGN